MSILKVLGELTGHGDTHASCGTCHHAHSGCEGEAVEVRHLAFGDRLDLVPGDGGNLLAVRLSGSGGNLGRFFQGDSHGRLLDFEGEGLVGIDCDDDGKDLARAALRGCIESLAELHDIQAFGTECRSYRRCRIRSSAFDLELDKSGNFFCHDELLFFSYLCKAEFELCLPSEDHHNYLDLAPVFQNLIDGTAEPGEGTVRDADGLADLVVDEGLGGIVGIFVLNAEDPLRLILPDRHGDALELGAAGRLLFREEPGHAGNEIPDDVLKLGTQFGLDKYITREKQLVDCLPLAVFRDNFLFDGNKYLSHLVLKSASLDLFLEILLGLLLLPSCCPQDVPFHIAHNESRLQCVDSGHQRLESVVDHPEHDSQEDGRDDDEESGALQLRPGRPRRLLSKFGEGLLAVIDKLSHLYI